MNKREGLIHIEIAEYLNISLKTVEGDMTRAFKILGDKLGPKIKPMLFLLFDFRNQLDPQRKQTAEQVKFKNSRLTLIKLPAYLMQAQYSL